MRLVPVAKPWVVLLLQRALVVIVASMLREL